MSHHLVMIKSIFFLLPKIFLFFMVQDVYGQETNMTKGSELDKKVLDNTTKITNKNASKSTSTTTPILIPTPTPTPTIEVDRNGIRWLVAKGEITTITQTRDDNDDLRWSGNVKGLRNGFEATMIVTFSKIDKDGHFAFKHFGPNHSDCNNPKKCAWYDTGIRQNGDIQLEIERPHPDNEDFRLGDELKIKNIGKGMSNNTIGLKWAVQTLKPNGTSNDGGIRLRMWVDTYPITGGKANNNWTLVYDFVDTGQIIGNYTPPNEQDCEIRISGHNAVKAVFGGGLHVRKL